MLFCRLILFIVILSGSRNVKASRTLYSDVFNTFQGIYENVKSRIFPCHFEECCDHEKWMPSKLADLSSTLQAKVYGQHLVVGPVIRHLKGHAKSSPKALVFSFHGPTGTGKNYVSKLVVEHMFTKGMDSKYVHLFDATRDFPHYSRLQYYKDELRQTIENAVRECPKSVFIFDEMDKMPPGLIDTIKPYLEYHGNLGGVDYRKTTFFFLSNLAGHLISDEVITRWKNGKAREALTLKEMEEVIRLPAYNTENGLFKSEIVAKGLITAYIPFLPLERGHVKQCIRYSLAAKGYRWATEVKLQEIADELVFIPKGIERFAANGCKKVDVKVDLVMQDDDIRDEL